MSENKYSVIIKDYLKDIYSLSITSSKIEAVREIPKPPAALIYSIIMLDPVLIAKVMKLINSSYFGVSGKVISIVKAMVILGLNTTKNLVMKSSAALVEKKIMSHDIEIIFWKHSLFTAITAKNIAQKLDKKREETEKYYIAGMMHDFGKIPILVCFPDEYRLILDQCTANSKSPLDSESNFFGFNHCDIGKRVAESWNLGSRLEAVIQYHHNPGSLPEGEDSELVNIISIADYFANISGYGFAGKECLDKPAEAVFKLYGINIGMLEELKPKIIKELEEAQNFLGVKI